MQAVTVTRRRRAMRLDPGRGSDCFSADIIHGGHIRIIRRA